jgi:molecular chaperone GrpE
LSEQNHEQPGATPEQTADTTTETEVGTNPGAPGPEAASGETARDAATLAEELAQEKDKNLRLYAEFDNFRRRTAKESFDMMATANAKLVEKMCEVLENFGRAFEAQATASPEDFEKGIRLIYGRFKEILDAEGLEEIDPVGTEFDPNLHDALLQQASDTVPENHVVQVISKGYKLKSKILKHAKVIVSTGPQ